MTRLTNSVDAWVREGKPGQNNGDTPALRVKSGTDPRRAFIRFSRAFPLGSSITRADVSLTIKQAFTGTKTFTLRRALPKWSEGQVNWNNQPAVTGDGVTEEVTDGQVGQVITFDCKPIFQEVSDGGAYSGLRLVTDSTTAVVFYSSEAAVDGVHPFMDVDWSEAPEPPTDLAPSDLLTYLTHPYLSWTYRDLAGNTEQASAQIQISTVSDFSTVEWDSTKFALTESGYDLASSTYPGLPTDGSARYWRVGVWDGTDLASGYSDPALVAYAAKGDLTLQSPTEVVLETTPPVSWTLDDATQESYIILLEVLQGSKWEALWRTGIVASTDNSVTIPKGRVKSTTDTYRVTVSVFDDEERYNSPTEAPQVVAQQEFTFEKSATITPVSDLTADITPGAPQVVLEWTYATQPDAWSIVVDGEEVDQVEAQELFVSGTTYRYDYWGTEPRKETTFEVAAVVLDAGEEKHSTPNATQAVETRPTGVWFACREEGLVVPIQGTEEADVSIGISAGTFTPKGTRKTIRITDGIRGYEGTWSGTIVAMGDGRTAQDLVDEYLRLVAISGQVEIRLVLGHLNIPVEIEPGKLQEKAKGEKRFDVSFAFWQQGDWPMEVDV